MSRRRHATNVVRREAAAPATVAADRLSCWSALTVGAPLLLALVEVFHPRVRHVSDADTTIWMFVHYAQLALFPLAALAMAQLVRNRADVGAALCRVAMFVFATTYVAFDTAAGVVTGILVDAARSSGSADAWRPAIDTVWLHPVVGGASPLPALAVLGSTALPVGAIGAAISLRRARVSWAPLLVLVGASFAIWLFRTHAWPGGPLAFGGQAIAAAWLEWQRRSGGTVRAR